MRDGCHLCADAVVTAEIRVGDNDNLSALVAGLIAGGLQRGDRLGIWSPNRAHAEDTAALARSLRVGEAKAFLRARGIEVIGRNARAQTKLIEDILDYARITSGKLKPIA